MVQGPGASPQNPQARYSGALAQTALGAVLSAGRLVGRQVVDLTRDRIFMRDDT